jgi:hypothetical protein
MKINLKAAMRQECHAFLDELWETKVQRQAVYKWLACKMRIPLAECHISKMSVSRLYKARRILRAAVRKKRKKLLKN